MIIEMESWRRHPGARGMVLLAAVMTLIALLGVMADCERRNPDRGPRNPTGDGSGTIWHFASSAIRIPRAPARALPAPGEVDVIAGDSTAANAYFTNPARDALLKRLSDEVCGMYCGTPGHATVLSVAHGGQRLTGSDPSSLLAQWPTVLATPGLRTVWVLIGINDMGLCTEQQFGDAYVSLVLQAQAVGVRVIPVLMLPIGSQRTDIEHSANGHAGRVEMNSWLTLYFGAANVVDTGLIKNPWSEWIDPAYAQPNDAAHVHENPPGAMYVADVMAAALG